MKMFPSILFPRKHRPCRCPLPIVAVLLLSVPCSAANSPFAAFDKHEYGLFNHGGMEFGASTEGFRLGLGAAATPFLELAVGVNYMPAFTLRGDMSFVNSTVSIPAADGSGTNTYALSTVAMEGKFDRLTFDAKLYFYPLGTASTLFVVGGLSFGGGRLASLSGHSDEAKRIYDENQEYFDHATAQYGSLMETVVGKSAMSLSTTGDVSGEVRLPKVRPYVGAGIGRLIPRSGIGVRLEAGVEFTGRYKVYQDDQELDYQETLQRADNSLAKLIDRMKVYPILKLTISGLLF